MAMPRSILVVEDDPDLREALLDILSLAGFNVRVAADGSAALEQINQANIGLVLTDIQMHPMDGYSLLLALKREQPWLPVILMTAYGDIEKAVQALQHGAANYLVKPFEPRRLLEEIQKHLLPASSTDEDAPVAQDPASAQVLGMALKVAQSDATVLLCGESGVGKEVFARYIHRQSKRNRGPFVAINCAAIPETLLEATLFGHEKGAYTGAQQAQAGKFEQANGGTLLLDEITEMSLPLQSKLLRVLQERVVERVGGHKLLPLDVRIIATSNRDLPAEVAAGRFREDLYYRLSVFPLEIPPLRQRPADIPALAQHLLQRHLRRGQYSAHHLSEAALRELTLYGWKGNIRELDNVLQRALILASGAAIEPEHLRLPSPAIARPEPLAAPVLTLPSGPSGTVIDGKTLERQRVMLALASVQGSRKKAAELLGMSERTLRYRLQQYRLHDDEINTGEL